MDDTAQIRQKQMMGIPLSPQEQAIIDPAKYGLSVAQAPAEQQFTPAQLEMLSGMSSNQEEQGALDQQMQMANSLRDAKVPQGSRVQMSSGTSYEVPNDPWGTVAQNFVGQMQANRLRKEQKALREQDRKARKEYMDAVVNPKTAAQKQMDDMIYGANEGARARAAAAPASTTPPTLSERLRKFRQEHMTI
jgi:hypothetical protein